MAALVYMSENPNPSFFPNPNFYPNPNPNFSQNPISIPSPENDSFPESEEPSPPPAAVATSCDSSSLNRTNDPNYRDSDGHLSCKISKLSKIDRQNLKRKLNSELEQIRSVISKIEAIEFRSNNLKKLPDLKKLNDGIMKRCGQILTKLMRSKGAVWFNTPVDAVKMGLHDYHQIIKNPMDFGTVKSKISKGVYDNVLDFAKDVRLTFNNALAYNPVGHEVHKIASQLLKQFESLFGSAYSRYEKQKNEIEKKFMQMHRPPMNLVPRIEKPVIKKQAKEEMSMKDKEKLGMALQCLPDEKMNEVLQIIKDMNVNALLREGEEVEIDFELMNNDTIWALDRFVKDWNNTKILIKERQVQSEPSIKLPVEIDIEAKKGVEDDVEIVDDMPATHFPPVEIENEKKESSSSSSSGSDSSSSDSDSGSSSGSDSDNDDDDAKSPETKKIEI